MILGSILIISFVVLVHLGFHFELRRLQQINLRHKFNKLITIKQKSTSRHLKGIMNHK